MPVELQNRLFKYFTDTLNAIVSQAKRTGKYDMGILGEYLKTFIDWDGCVVMGYIIITTTLKDIVFANESKIFIKCKALCLTNI